MSRLLLYVAVEDRLSEAVVRRLLQEYRSDVELHPPFVTRGNVALMKRLPSWNQAAVRLPFLVLTDLDRRECAPSLIGEWLPRGIHSNLLLRVAVREVEAWLLADGPGWAGFLGVHPPQGVLAVESYPDPKEQLLREVRKCKKRTLKQDLLPAQGTSAQIGPNYNNALIGFVEERWKPERARHHADSLDRMIRAIERFRPSLPD